jgi:hypothetical protein
MRFLVVDNGVVVGTLQAQDPPTIDIPPGRVFVKASDLPDIKGGEEYDPKTGIFTQPVPDVVVSATVESRLAQLESDVQSLKKQKV